MKVTTLFITFLVLNIFVNFSQATTCNVSLVFSQANALVSASMASKDGTSIGPIDESTPTDYPYNDSTLTQITFSNADDTGFADLIFQIVDDQGNVLEDNISCPTPACQAEEPKPQGEREKKVKFGRHALACVIAGTPSCSSVSYNLDFVCPAIVGGDPHFLGFNGKKFTPQLTSNAVYNLITDKDMQLNCGTFGKLYRSVGDKEVERVYMNSLGLVLNSGTTFAINIEDNNPVVHINNRSYRMPLVGQRETLVDRPDILVSTTALSGELELPPSAQFLKNSFLGWHVKYLHYIIDVNIEGYALNIYAIDLQTPLVGKQRPWGDWILDFSANVISSSVGVRTPHGLFGQTYRPHLSMAERDVIETSKFSIEGEVEDYKVNGDLFQSDFTFNQFLPIV